MIPCVSSRVIRIELENNQKPDFKHQNSSNFWGIDSNEYVRLNVSGD